MKRLMLTLAMTTAASALIFSNPGAAQILPPAKKAGRVVIVKPPEVELSTDFLTIIRWTTNNPGGADVHYGIVRYGKNPKDLNRMARNPIRLNQGHNTTTFRVRLDDLEPKTTYYYTVASEESDGTSDGVVGEIRKFTTPGLGERVAATP
jgi:hypothetical protein